MIDKLTNAQLKEYLELCVEANFIEKHANRACTDVLAAVFATIEKRQTEFKA